MSTRLPGDTGGLSAATVETYKDQRSGPLALSGHLSGATSQACEGICVIFDTSGQKSSHLYRGAILSSNFGCLGEARNRLASGPVRGNK
jgi:hypothetical protein